jgi:DHA1 family bicyclomycin/chloramphenicol resistance-like MFS transporter
VLSIRELKETAIASRPRATYLSSYMQLLRSARFWGFALCMAFGMETLFLFLAGAPLVFAGSSALLGLYMGIVPCGFIFGSFLSGRFARRAGRGRMLVVARLLTCMGLLGGLALAAMGITHAFAFFGPCIFIGIGNGLTMPAANMGVMSVRNDLAGTAAGLAAAISVGGGALVVSVAGLLLKGMETGHTLLTVMLVAASFALTAAAFVARDDRQVLVSGGK